MPQPSDPRRPPKVETGEEEVTSRDTRRQDGSPTEQRYPTPRQQLLEANKRCRRRLAALARDHIMKLREERDRMAYDWSEEYAMRASSAKQSGAGLSTLRAEYVHRYNRLLEREKQPHSDFFINLSEDFEDELDFNEDKPAELSQYDQYFEWDEAEYMKLRFTAARHYASRGHWTDAYAYVLRTRPDNIPQHEDTYNKNAQAWHYTNARINELVQEVEQILEAQDRQMSEESQFGPPQGFIDTPWTFHWDTIPNEVSRGKNKSLGNHLKQLPPGGQGDKVEELPLSLLILQIRSPREMNETQLLMQSNKLLGPRQRPQDKGE